MHTSHGEERKLEAGKSVVFVLFLEQNVRRVLVSNGKVCLAFLMSGKFLNCFFKNSSKVCIFFKMHVSLLGLEVSGMIAVVR